MSKSTKLIMVVAWMLPAAVSAEPLSSQIERLGVTFRVESPNNSSINVVTTLAEIVTGQFGVEEDRADGTVTTVEVDDLDAGGYPEVYIYVSSAGSGSYGSLIAYASNRNQSLSRIQIPPFEPDSEIATGYMGHDEFAIDEGVLVRRFPVYRPGDPNARPSGGTRQIQYVLEVGEAGPILRPMFVEGF